MVIPRISHLDAPPLPNTIDVHVGTAIILEVDERLGISLLGVWVSKNSVLRLNSNLSVIAKQ